MSKKNEEGPIYLKSQQEIHNWLECLESASTVYGHVDLEDDEEAAEEVSRLADAFYEELLARIKS